MFARLSLRPSRRAASVSTAVLVLAFLPSGFAQGPQVFVGSPLELPSVVRRHELSTQDGLIIPARERTTSQSYKVDGIELGEKIDFASRHSGFSCRPSTTYSGFRFCQRMTRESEARGEFNSARSLLVSGDGRAYYVNR